MAYKHFFEGIRLTRQGDPEYPSNLTSFPGAPDKLWYRGGLRPGDSYSVAVIGSRLATEPGQARAKRLGLELGEAGVTVVSGLAQGIDSAAHQGALQSGRTVAVIGTGLHRLPGRCPELLRGIEQNGAIVSQHDDPRFTGYPGGRHFLKRNVIVAGIAQVTVVVEAQLRSGTAHTIRQALNLGRRVGLLQSLVQSQAWAAQLAEQEQVFTVKETGCILERMVA